MKMKTNELDMLREMLQGELNALLERARLTVGQLVDEVYIYAADPLAEPSPDSAVSPDLHDGLQPSLGD